MIQEITLQGTIKEKEISVGEKTVLLTGLGHWNIDISKKLNLGSFHDENASIFSKLRNDDVLGVVLESSHLVVDNISIDISEECRNSLFIKAALDEIKLQKN